MAFDHNLVSKDMMPLNVAHPVTADDVRIAAVSGGTSNSSTSPNSATAAAAVMSPEFFSSPDATIPVFYPAVPDTGGGFVGVGYRNVGPAAVPQWVPVAAGNVNIGMAAPQAVGVVGYNPNLGNRVVGNAVDQSSSEMLVGFGSKPMLDGNGSNELLNPGYCHSPSLGNRGNGSGGGGTDHASEDGVDDPISGKKIKLLCSFGGKILPRPTDGALRYVGGQTRIISLRREVNFVDLMQKMVDTYAQPVVLKYQLPDEDLDALVSVSCPEDLDNMLDEYDKLVERSSDGSAKLRVFLFSATELDASGMVHLGDMHDSEQRYVEAVNGTAEIGDIGVISRKESMASATSTQNSDISGAEAVDSISGSGQGEMSGPLSVGGLTPKANSVTSQDVSPRLLHTDPTSPIYAADASSVSLGIPLMKSGSPPALRSPHEVDFERSAPVNVSQQHHMGYELPQTGMPVQSSAPHLQAYRDPRQDYLHTPPQMGYPNPQMLGSPGGSLFSQQPMNDVNASLSPHQFIPTVHMTMAPSSSLAPMRPTMLQPLMQAQKTRVDHCPDEKTYGTQLMQIPVDPTYNMYQPAIFGGGYSWRHVQQPDHVVYSDGMIRHQQASYPERISRPDDHFMCQKALPHAHSDPVVRDQSPPSVEPVYHSLHLEDSAKLQPMNRGVMVTGAAGEGTLDQGAGARHIGSGHMEQTAQSKAMELPQNVEAIDEYEKISPSKKEAPEKPKLPVPVGIAGLPCDAQSDYGQFMGTIPQFQIDDSLHQHGPTTMHSVNQDAPLNMHVHDVPRVAGAPIQTSKGMLYESPKAPAGNLPHVISKVNTIDSFFSYDPLKPTEGINGSSGIKLSNEPKKQANDQKTQQVAARELLLDSALNKPQVVSDLNYVKSEDQPTAEFSYLHSSQPMEPYNVAQPSHLGDPGAHLHTMVGSLLDSGDVSCVNPQYVGEPVYQVDRLPPVSESSDDISKLLPDTLSGDMESLTLSGNAPSAVSVSSSRTVKDIQDSTDSLFSNQDPWNFRHDTHFPPKPLKIAARKDAVGAGDPFRENPLDNAAESVPDVLLDGGISQTLHGSVHPLSSKGSEDKLIKEELQAVAEGVAASVLTSSTPSAGLTGHEKNESPSQGIESTEFANKDVETHHKVKAEFHQDLKNKQPERVNLGFQMSEGAGRLQIIKSSDLEELQELGSGTFGTVYHGKWRGTDVAIKRINDRCFVGKPSEQERMRDDFWNEAIKLADLHHPNVVAFYGVVLDGPGGSVATVTEYMVNGSLRTALLTNERTLDKQKRLLIAMDVAFGMEYLHGKNIVHFDLKSDNLLVNLRDPHRPICKVGDLGLSKVKCQTLISGGVRGTLPWMAPELLNGSSSLVSEKVDVFSFGIVLWELLTGEEPYSDLHYGAIIGGIVSNTLRPAVPESCDLEWKSLMERCWASEPSERPSFTEVANELRAMASKMQSPKGHTQSHQLSHAQ
ncbi:Serine/threonine-protein kinase CTR1 [Linum perenne]